MGFYGDTVLPHLLNLAMGSKALAAYRRRLVPCAAGRVLEVRIGSGLNLPFYGPGVRELIGLDLSASLLRMAGSRVTRGGVAATMIEGSAEAIPLEAASVDTVLTTWVLCSIHDPGTTLAEMRRVLKPTGELVNWHSMAHPQLRCSLWQPLVRVGTWREPVGFHVVPCPSAFCPSCLPTSSSIRCCPALTASPSCAGPA